MKKLICRVVALLVASPAFAEVCDKVRPSWEPSSGNIDQFDESYFFITSPLGLGLLLLIAAALYFRRRWLSIICAVLVFLVAVVTALNWFWLDGDIVRAARGEGCIASPIITIGVLVLLSGWIFSALLGRRHFL